MPVYLRRRLRYSVLPDIGLYRTQIDVSHFRDRTSVGGGAA
jgi:hypothetical protein